MCELASCAHRMSWVDAAQNVRHMHEYAPFGWGAEFQRIEWLLEYPDIRKGKLGEATVFLIDTRALLAAALLKMSAEPYAFVTDISMYI